MRKKLYLAKTLVLLLCIIAIAINLSIITAFAYDTDNDELISSENSSDIEADSSQTEEASNSKEESFLPYLWIPILAILLAVPAIVLFLVFNVCDKIAVKFIWTVIHLGFAFFIFMYAFISGAVRIEDWEFVLYPNGTDWLCVIGFAVICLPAVFSIIGDIRKITRKSASYYDGRETITTWTDEFGNVERVEKDNKDFERFIVYAIGVVAAGAIIYFLSIYFAIGFTLYRISVLIYCLVAKTSK